MASTTGELKGNLRRLGEIRSKLVNSVNKSPSFPRSIKLAVWPRRPRPGIFVSHWVLLWQLRIAGGAISSPPRSRISPTVRLLKCYFRQPISIVMLPSASRREHPGVKMAGWRRPVIPVWASSRTWTFWASPCWISTETPFPLLDSYGWTNAFPVFDPCVRLYFRSPDFQKLRFCQKPRHPGSDGKTHIERFKKWKCFKNIAWR